jgi:peptide/nickel transport system substrate-binding protein
MNHDNNVPSRFGYDRIADVSAPNATTVIVRLHKPFSEIIGTFLTMDFNYPIMPEHTLGSLRNVNHADVERPIIGSGPFTLVDWKHGDHLTFAANPRYFRGPPRLRRLVLRIVPSTSTIVNQLHTGEIDGALEVADPELAPQLSAIPGIHTILTPAAGLLTIYFNLESSIAGDNRIRDAIGYALDTNAIVQRATAGLYQSMNALRGEFGADALSNPTHYDRLAARAILDADGWKVGPNGVRLKGGKPLAIRLIYSTETQTVGVIAAQVEQALRAVGIDTSLQSYNATMMMAPAAEGGAEFGGRFDLAIMAIYDAPVGPFAASNFVCSERAPTGFNLARMCDPALDMLYQDILSSYDGRRQSQDTRAIERLLRVQLPEIPLMQLRTIAAVSDRVHNVAPSPTTPYIGVWKWSTNR